MTTLHFKISTGLKDIIGRELITNDFIAVSELAKNSYDALAKTARIIFKDTKTGSKNSKIIISDDGKGMSIKDIEKKWLFVGYSEKKNKKTIGKGRIPAGAKGIGRFSCDRLGKKLKILTKTKDEKKINVIEINWEDFEKKQEQEFQSVDVENYHIDNLSGYEETELNGKESFAILEISDLRSDWDADKLLKLKSHLQRLINPENSDSSFKILLIAKEYTEEDKEYGKKWGKAAVINGKIENMLLEKLNQYTTRIESSVDNGTISTSLYDNNILVFNVAVKNETYTKLDNIYIRIFYLNKGAKISFTRLMGQRPREYGSIFLYRGGFRVQTLGEPGNDWLGIDSVKQQGTGRHLGTRELFGTIIIKKVQEGFTEITNRESLVTTTQFEQLQEYATGTIDWLEKYVIQKPGWGSIIDLTEEPTFRLSVMKAIKKIVGDIGETELKLRINYELFRRKPEIFEDRKTFTEMVKNLDYIKALITDKEKKSFFEEQVRDIKRYNSNLLEENQTKEKEILFLSKAMTPDKEVFVNLNHTIGIYAGNIKAALNELYEKFKDNKEITPLLDDIGIDVEKIRALAGYASVAGFNTKIEKINADIISYIIQYAKNVESGIFKLNFSFEGIENTFDAKFTPLELSILVDNFISNSKKANASKIKIIFKKHDGSLKIYFCDNGKGIKEKDTKYLFTRGFTTTDGSGLGLYNIKKIALSMNGSAKFIGNNIYGMPGACFEVVLNA